MMDLFRNANFVRLFIATMASQLGTMVGNMAFAFYLLNRFSSQPSYATIAELMYTLPTLFVFLIVGMAADRFHRKHIAEYSDWIRAGLTIILMLSIAKDWVVFSFLILFLRSAVAKFFGPAEAAMIQGILTPEQYAQVQG
ncbi:MFS transporter [Paenibacillus larvae]|nr:MFS transporter [Paenibacillus larvae]MDT2305878.1 MFS transporter [Paenibacillus larvae]